MTVFLPILVCLCGGVGASCRYLLDVTIKTYLSLIHISEPTRP